MQRRHLLGAAPALLAAPLAAPRIALGQRALPLRFVPFADLTVLDPHASTSYVTRGHALMVYDTLFGLDAQMRPQPQMLESAAVTEEGRRWTLVLRPGLRFHDNEPVRAADVVASLARWAKADGFGQLLYAQVEEVSAPDDRTVVFRLKKPFPQLPAALAKVTTPLPCIMPARLCEGPPSVAVKEIIGSGPFRYLPAESLAGSSYAYARFDGYVPRPGGTPSFTAGPKVAKLERVEFRIIPDDSTASNALVAGEVDWYDQIQPDQIPLLRRNRNLVVEPCEATGYVGFFVMNQAQPPFDNPAIRHALLPALDQADVGRAVMGDDPSLYRTGLGYFTPGTPLANDVGMAALTAPRDLDAARKALAAAGYKGEKINILTGVNLGFVHAMNLVTADTLRRIGMNAEVLDSDLATMMQRRMRNEGWNAYCIGAVGLQAADPAVNSYLRGFGGPFNFARSPRIEALRNAWMEAPDLPAQQQQARALQGQAFEDVPYVPIGQFLVQTAYRNTLRRAVKEMSVLWGVERG